MVRFGRIAVALVATGLVASLGRGGQLAPGRPQEWRLPVPDLYSVGVDGDRVWAVGYWGAVLRSADRGATWTAIATPTRDTLFDLAFADEDHGWVVGENGVVLRTVDGGLTWARQRVDLRDEFGSRPLDVHLFGISAVSPEQAWAVGDLGIVLRTRDGESWEQVALPEEAFADEEVPDRILNAVDFPDSRHGFIVGEFGTTLRTVDGGENWTGQRRFIGAPDALYLFDVSARDAQHAAAVGLAGTVLVTQDGGHTWEARRVDSSASLYGVSWADPGLVAVGNRCELFAWSDARRIWTRPTRPRLFNWLAAVTHAGATSLYAVGEKGLVLRSDDSGERWVQLHGRPPPPLSGVSVPDPGRSSELGSEAQQVPFAPIPER